MIKYISVVLTLCILSLFSCEKKVDPSPIIIEELEIREPEVNPLFVIRNNSKYGFINHEGTIVIPCIYDWTIGFSEGLALVELNGEKFFIDKEGNIKLRVPLTADVNNFKEGRAKLQNAGRSMYIDFEGNHIIHEKYVFHDYFYSNGYTRGTSLSTGKYDYLDRYGKVVIQGGFVNASKFSQGYALVYLNRNNTGDNRDFKKYIINKAGRMIDCDVCQGTSIPHDYDFYSEGMFRLNRPKYNGGGQNEYGYADVNLQLVIPFQFQDAKPFSEGLAAVMQDFKWGFIDKTGNVVIPFIFGSVSVMSGSAIGIHYGEGVGGFTEGLAAVMQNGKWGYINQSGSFVILV